jgi:hypothetical protein
MFMVGPPDGWRRGAADLFAALAQAFHQAARGGAFALAEGRRRNGRDLDIFTVRPVFETVDDFQKVEPGYPPVREYLVLFQSQLLPPLVRGRHILFRRFRYLPVLHLDSIVGHVKPPDLFIFSRRSLLPASATWKFRVKPGPGPSLEGSLTYCFYLSSASVSLERLT